MRDRSWRLHGSITALASPFRDGRLDEERLGAMVARQLARGTAGLVASGSTGEASMLSMSEHVRLIRAVSAVAAGSVPVIAGCTATATEVSRFLAVAAARAGADAVMLAPPPYVKPTQEGIAAHMRAVARAADLPVVLYDVPSRVAVAIADATVARLFAEGVVIALKDATGDLSRPARLRALCGPGLVQLTGEDAQTVAYRAAGGDGCVSVTANVAPALCALVQQCWDDGDIRRARDIEAMLAPLHAALFLESNPIPLKAALAEAALCADIVRAPLTPAVEATRAALARALAGVMPEEGEAARFRAAAPMRMTG
jgi:4-hydroxy-tetrahydrodipicolinate synthase